MEKSRLDRARLRPLVFIRGRIWAPAAKPERSLQIARRSPRLCANCVITDKLPSTITTSKATTDGWTLSRRVSSAQNSQRLAEWNAQRRQIAKAYGEQLAKIDGLVVPFEPSWSRGVYHLYVVQVPDRQEMQNSMKAAGVGTGIHYPVPLHLQQAYSGSRLSQRRFSHHRTSVSRDRFFADVPTTDRESSGRRSSMR